MKERGILFTPENVQLILDGAKVQTRRIIKLPKAPDHLGSWKATTSFTTFGGPQGGKTKDGKICPEEVAIWHTSTGKIFLCPFGTVGDRLYVYVKEGLKRKGGGIFYRRDDVMVPELDGPKVWRWQRDTLSPLHMPKDCARLLLEITNVQVQRLIAIPQLDAMHEGADGPDYKASYKVIWEAINGEGSWAANPYVWAISFTRIET